VTVGQAVLQPGEAGDVLVSLQINDPGPFTKSVAVATNDPAAPLLYFTLQGEVPVGVAIRPARVRAALDWGRPYERALRLTGPQQMEVAAATLRESLGEVAMEAIDPPREGMKAWDVRLTIPAGLAVGRHSDELRIETTLVDHPLVTAPVMIDVRSSYMVLPSSAFFGYVGVGAAKTASVVVRSRDGSPFRVIEAAVSHPAIAAEARVLGESEWRVDITCRLQEAGIIDSTVTLTTDLEHEPRLCIPVYADVGVGQ